MTDRLERIEALVESNAKNIEELTHSIRELKKCVDSNAKMVEVLIYQGSQLSEETKKYREIQRKDRNHVFQCMARLAAAQADFYEVQADYLRHVEQIDDRLTEILNRTTPHTEA